MIDSKALKTIIARLKIYKESLHNMKRAESQGYPAPMACMTPDHTELQRAIAELEAAQTQIVPGSLVRQKITGEIGRVVTIFNTNGFDDTYVAFWGQERPDSTQMPNPRPYVLRYCLSSLELVHEIE